MSPSPRDDRVRLPAFARFVGEQRRVNAAEDDPRAARARRLSDRIAAQRVAGVDADADDVARRDVVGVELRECLVDEERVAPFGAGRGRQDEQPARRDDGNPKRHSLGLTRCNANAHAATLRDTVLKG